jgi:hypothetical protein
MDLNKSTYVIIRTNKVNELKKIIQDFINLYCDIIKKLEIIAYKGQQDNIILVLPDDFDFDYVGTFIHSLKYTSYEDISFEGYGFVTIQKSNVYEFPKQRVMFYNQNENSKDEVVYFTTQKNDNYRLVLGTIENPKKIGFKKEFLEENWNSDLSNEIFKLCPNSDPLPKLPFKDRMKIYRNIILYLLIGVVILIILKYFLNN